MTDKQQISAVQLWTYSERLLLQVAHIRGLLEQMDDVFIATHATHQELQTSIIELREFLSVEFEIPDHLYDPEYLARLREDVPF